MFCWLVPWRCRMFQILWLDYNHNRRMIGTRVVWRWRRSNSKQSKYTSRTFLLLGRELEISDACTNGRFRWGNSWSHWNIRWCGGNKCGTKRGHFKLYAKERHIGGLAVWLWKITPVPVTTWHMQCVKKGSVGNTWLLPCAKMLLVPMKFFSNG